MSQRTGDVGDMDAVEDLAGLDDASRSTPVEIDQGIARAAEPFRKPNSAKRTTMERSLERALNNNLSYPLLEKGDMNGEVTVSLVIDREGKVVVLESRSTNERLKAYVLRKLARIDIGDNPEGSWKTTHIRFSFRPERG